MALEARASFAGRDLWTTRFESLVTFFSTGEFEKELLRAKNFFFTKLGRTHEMEEAFYNAVSQSFLEWFLFDYQLAKQEKSPAVTFMSREWGNEEEKAWVANCLFHHHSLFEVKAVKADKLTLRDLLIQKNRFLSYDKSDPSFQVWNIQEGQVIQARLFSDEDPSFHFFTHFWLHPESEWKDLKRFAESFAPRWGLHREMLRNLLECLIRSYHIADQLAAVRNRNWVYGDFFKRYGAEAEGERG